MEYKTLIITILISWGINFGFSQEQTRANIYFTIPEIATLDIEPNISDIIFNFNAPSEAGNPIETLSDNSKWLNYTSAITKGSVFRNITAQIDGIMPGIKIELTVGRYEGRGKGKKGTTTGKINLNTTSQTIITNIGGCYTNTGANSGHRLNYTVSINDYSLFEIPITPSVNVIFTIGI